MSERQITQILQIRDPAFERASAIAVDHNNYESLSQCYAVTMLTDTERKYLEFFLRHLYVSNNCGGYYGYA